MAVNEIVSFSEPNSNFQSHGFQYEPLVADRAVDFALDYWHCRYDLDKKNSAVKSMKEELRVLKHSFRRVAETMTEMKKSLAAKDQEVVQLEQRLVEMEQNSKKEKQTQAFQARSLSKNKILIESLQTELRSKVSDLQTAQQHLAQEQRAHKEETRALSQTIQTLTERNEKLSNNLQELREVESRTSRQLHDLQVERDFLATKLTSQQNLIEIREDSAFSRRESAPNDDFQSLEQVRFSAYVVHYAIMTR